MGRGLGKQQVKMLAAVRAVQAERGSDWLEPGEVLARLEAPTGDARTDALKMTIMLINATRRAARGDRQAAALAADLERQGASLSWKASAFTLPKPAGKRLSPPRRRNVERINPARIFAALEARGFVERIPGVAGASRIRLKMPNNPNTPNT